MSQSATLRVPLCKSLCRCLVAAMMVIGAASALPGVEAGREETTVQMTTTGEQTGDIQLADEIIRRLRRLGLNFNRARLPRPYDPAGDLC